MQPLISVIIPCYKQAVYLPDALRSILNQTYQSWECLIIDDGSPDETKKVAKEWMKKDHRFKYFYKENGGLSSARNLGLNKAEGELIQFLDADDVILESKFKKSVQQFKNKGADIVISNFRLFSNNAKKTTDPYCILSEKLFSFKNILLKWDIDFTIPIHCGVFNSKCFKQIRFNESLPAKEDWLMWLEVLKTYNPQVVFIDHPLALYRQAGQGMTTDLNHMKRNTIKACKIIYNRLGTKERTEFFDRIITELYDKITLYQNSRSYKIGNTIVKSINKIKPIKQLRNNKM